MKTLERIFGFRPIGLGLGVAVVICALIGGAAPAAAQIDLTGDEDLEDLLSQVGEDYAVSYASPFIFAFGPNQNSAQYQTAHIPWGKLQFGIGVKVMATQLNQSDQNFQKTIENVDLSDYDDSIPDGTVGDIVMSGPTMFGSTSTKGRLQGYVSGVEVLNIETIPGLVDTRWVPLATPEAYIGGIVGLKLTVRYFPDYDTGEYGKTSYFGYGLQWNANGVLKSLPLDLMAGFFTQNLDVGDIIKSEASTFFVGASKDVSAFTLYGGLASESSSMDVSYVYEVDANDPQYDTNVAFSVDGTQKSRITVGATFNFFLSLNVEAAFGKLSTYSAGLMLGF